MGIRHWSIFATLLILIGVEAIAPSAWAETKRIDIVLTADVRQPFEALINQAESAASKSIEQEFAQSPSVTAIDVLISAESDGQQVPIWSSKVYRSDWQKNPSIRRWTRFIGSDVLLGFYNRSASPSPSSQYAPGSARNRLEGDPGYRDE